MFQNGNKVKVICGDHKGKAGIITGITKGRDLPNGKEIQQSCYIIELENKEILSIYEECLESNHD